MNGRRYNAGALTLWAMAAVLGLAWIYIIARARNVSFVCDEALSYGIIHGESTFVDTPNNQWLNTVLMRMGQFAFGESELALRLPNVVVFGVYGAAVLVLLSRVRHFLARLAGFTLFIINPFLLEFFGLARGYGLSMAFSAAAIACVFLGRPASSRRQITLFALTGIFGALAFYANFSTLNLVLALLGVELIDVGKSVLISLRSTRAVNRRELVPVAIVLASGASLLPGILYLRHLQKIGQLYYGGHSGLLSDTVGSLLRSSSCGFECQPAWLSSAKATVAVIVLLGVAWTAYRWLRHPRWRNVTRASTMFVTAVVAAALESSLLGTLYPIDRTALSYVVLFGVFITFVINDLIDTFRGNAGQIVIGVPLACFAVLASVNLAHDVNLTRTTVWAYDASSREVIDALRTFEHRHGPPRKPWKLISGFPRDEALDYYKRRFHMWWLQTVGREPVSTPDGNFYYAATSELSELPRGTRLLASFGSTGTQLRLARLGVIPAPRQPESSAPTGASISATPNPVPAGPVVGNTTITWSAIGFPHAEVLLSVDGLKPHLFASGATGSAPARFITAGSEYTFSLYSGGNSQQRLAVVVVTHP